MPDPVRLAGRGATRPGGAAAPRKDVVRNRERLLAAADELAAERGLDVSFNAIAARAGVGVGTVYRHFADPDAVLDQLVESRVRRVVQTLDEAQTADDPIEGLRAAILATGDLQAQDRGVWGAFTSGPRQAATARASLGPPTARIVERAIESGRVRPDFSVTDYVIVLWIADALSRLLGDVDVDAWRRYVEILLAGFERSSDAHDQRHPGPGASLSIEDFDRALEGSRRAAGPFPGGGSSRPSGGPADSELTHVGRRPASAPRKSR